MDYETILDEVRCPETPCPLYDHETALRKIISHLWSAHLKDGEATASAEEHRRQALEIAITSLLGGREVVRDHSVLNEFVDYVDYLKRKVVLQSLSSKRIGHAVEHLKGMSKEDRLQLMVEAGLLTQEVVDRAKEKL